MSKRTSLPILPDASDSASRIRLLVSACLLGDNVRYDGQHKYDSFLMERLGPFVTWERVCPESDCGMPTPRPSMHLVGDPKDPRLVSSTGADLTEPMRRFTEEKLRKLDDVELCGYVCKQDSPSSGMTQVKVYDGSSRSGNMSHTGTNFVDGATVSFGGVAATSVVVASATSITATTPAHAAGKVDVAVANPDAQSVVLNDGFTHAAATELPNGVSNEGCDCRASQTPGVEVLALVAVVMLRRRKSRRDLIR